jgi:hypothetical protein
MKVSNNGEVPTQSDAGRLGRKLAFGSIDQRKDIEECSGSDRFAARRLGKNPGNNANMSRVFIH